MIPTGSKATGYVTEGFIRKWLMDELLITTLRETGKGHLRTRRS